MPSVIETYGIVAGVSISIIAAMISFTGIVINAWIAYLTYREVKAMHKQTHATAFQSVYNMVQTDEVRDARRFVCEELADKPFESWTKDDRLKAEKVCYSYDCVAIMVKNEMIPSEVIADSWGDSLRRTWRILSPLVASYRALRNAEETWNDYEWLAREAEKYQKPVHAGNK